MLFEYNLNELYKARRYWENSLYSILDMTFPTLYKFGYHYFSKDAYILFEKKEKKIKKILLLYLSN